MLVQTYLTMFIIVRCITVSISHSHSVEPDEPLRSGIAFQETEAKANLSFWCVFPHFPIPGTPEE